VARAEGLELAQEITKLKAIKTNPINLKGNLMEVNEGVDNFRELERSHRVMDRLPTL
jgi:hypothetical protein